MDSGLRQNDSFVFNDGVVLVAVLYLATVLFFGGIVVDCPSLGLCRYEISKCSVLELGQTLPTTPSFWRRPESISKTYAKKSEMLL